jgi:hypothetical protein
VAGSDLLALPNISGDPHEIDFENRFRPVVHGFERRIRSRPEHRTCFSQDAHNYNYYARSYYWHGYSGSKYSADG